MSASHLTAQGKRSSQWDQTRRKDRVPSLKMSRLPLRKHTEGLLWRDCANQLCVLLSTATLQVSISLNKVELSVGESKFFICTGKRHYSVLFVNKVEIGAA
uniref:Uncharacterized protein n=1 Tax=Knipowitschia caucasica TaxID=637954 RepID=A0AAV2LDJ6_KNICA